VRARVLEQGFDVILFNTVKEWIAKDWPFKKVAYPGKKNSYKFVAYYGC